MFDPTSRQYYIYYRMRKPRELGRGVDCRIAVSDEDAERMTGELNVILGFVEQLNEVDTSGIEPMTSVIIPNLSRR